MLNLLPCHHDATLDKQKKMDGCTVCMHITHLFDVQVIGKNHPTVKLHFHLYDKANEGLAVQRQSAEICHFYEKGIILMHIMYESPL